MTYAKVPARAALPQAARRRASAVAIAETHYVHRLGKHHFAHLRAVAEGVAVIDCARRYLGVDHGHQAKSAHQQTVDRVRAIARRRSEASWRLIGLTIRLPPDADPAKPSLDDFIAERELDGWSHTEVLAMYQEAYPSDRKTNRRSRLRDEQLALLRRLEMVAAEQPESTDLVSGWFDDLVSAKLISAGLVTLADLNNRVAAGGRWYTALPAIGEAKARRIESHLATLLPRAVRPARPVFALSPTSSLFGVASGLHSGLPWTGSPNLLGTGQGTRLASPMIALPASGSTAGVVFGTPQGAPNRLTLAGNTDCSGVSTPFSGALNPATTLTVSDASSAIAPSPSPTLLKARSDLEAVESWIAARSGSGATAKAYQREANRLLLWLQYERSGRALGAMDVEDCGDYMAFLQNIPHLWISRARAAPGTPGWAPFRGPLSPTSHRQAISIIAGLFAWLQATHYLQGNPWLLVNHKTGDEKEHRMLDSKAFSEPAMAQVILYVEAQAPSQSRARILFILRFVEAVGLRSAELLNARLGDLQLEPEGWVIQVHGKGSKNRIAAVPGQALKALQAYLKARHLEGIEVAPTTAPLLASTQDPMAPVGYQAMYEHVRSWIGRAISASDLPMKERLKMARASTHWLRHTFGTRAIAREVPLDVIQAQMGHASIQTTTAIYGRAPIRRRVDELGKAFG